MERIPLMKLDLRSPLTYARTVDLPAVMAENEEFLLCFDLDRAQSLSIEPESELLLGRLVFSGRKSGGCDSFQAEEVFLPAGIYLFVQAAGALDRKEWLDLAIEQQKDGLWERHKPENRLYVRFLHEEGKFATQLFRPLPN
jgi:hypothetical protein